METAIPVAEPINIHDAKTHFSRLVDRVEAGEEIVIARDGHPVARLVPLHPLVHSRAPGIWRGLVHLAPDFDQTDDSLLDAFEA
jgi:prevent-host-death family protein